ncbi:tetratricopeptide repeat protein [Actinoplanes sp. LDG1-06]|uniref:Tetratricopeptide repeat protein n=1 Tax=Paractinoplanes ovalisporus TaxID=2810368 RepID=A0ABS2AKI9_9ACTN|nr:tetratricopeptide repeat protein [Actinoplanes ovalisporus]MBM2620352.1 tetratricopeptide repeat protein [Actinoplanes ovalisporus]
MDRVEFVVDAALLDRLAHWGGNVSALHRELVAEAGGARVPSLATLHRAITKAQAVNAPPPRDDRPEPPDPGVAMSMDELTGRLHALKVWAGDPSYARITTLVNAAWRRSGRPSSELVGRTTVGDCFRPGRRRLSVELVTAIVQVLHPDPAYLAQWQQALQIVAGQRRAASQVRVYGALPPELPLFTGREEELRRLRDTLTPYGPVVIATIEGMAGVGKTQLAVRAAHQVPYEKTLFVSLRGFDPDPGHPPADPVAVLDGFLRQLGVSGSNVPHDLDACRRLYNERLSGSRTLIVLDNAVDADQVRPLLPSVPGCSVLVTSRRSLDALNPAVSLTLDVFGRPEALRLLTDEVGEAAVHEDPDAAARITELCGRLPLALGLIAAQVRAKPGWALADHAEWLDERRRAGRLDDGVTLALDRSYENLDADRQRLLRLVALHPAEDFDAYAAAALTGGDLESVRTGLRQLYEDHLVTLAGDDRYTQHDLIRLYAAERAHEQERPADRRAALTRLFDHYLATTVGAMKILYPTGADRRPPAPPTTAPVPALTGSDAASAWLSAEHPTLLVVATYAADHEWPTHTTRLAEVLFSYLLYTSYRDLLAMNDRAAAAARSIGDARSEAKALSAQGVAFTNLGQNERAADRLERSVELFRSINDVRGQAHTVMNLANLTFYHRGPAAAKVHYEKAHALYLEADDRIGESRSLHNLGYNEGTLGNFDEAIDYLTRALAIHQELSDLDSAAKALSNMADIETRCGRLDEAQQHGQEALALSRRLGNRNFEADALDALGLVHTRRGDPERAITLHEQALALKREVGDRVAEADIRNGLGEATRAAGRLELSVAHFEAALAITGDDGMAEQRARAYTGLGHTLAEQGDPVGARGFFERALNLYVEHDMYEADSIRRLLASGTGSRTTTS